MPIHTARQESNGPADDAQGEPRQTENPYASTSDFEPAGIFSSDVELSPIGLVTTLFVWTGVCSLSAAPSFIFAAQELAKNQAIAMVIGVLIFIGLYSAADLLTRERPFRKDARMRTILRATFIVRSIMVILFPIATVTDVILGMFSVGFVQSVSRSFKGTNGTFDSKLGFGETLATTLVQGWLLSVLLFFLGLFITAIILVTRSLMNRF